jgi:adenosine deaminase
MSRFSTPTGAEPPAVLLCTLGLTWAVVPEILGFVAPERFDFYREHPQCDQFRQETEAFPRPSAIWVVTTDAPQTTASLAHLAAWRDRLTDPPELRVWQVDPGAADEVTAMRELILRAVLAASERATPERLLLSLAGGRKTMSADLQRAGTLFGCRAMLHVIDVARLPEALSKPDPARLAAPLAADESAALRPLIVGRGQRAEHLDVDDGAGRVTASRFPLPEPPPFARADDAQLWPYQPGLAEELERREHEGQRLLGNFFGQLAREEHHENWRGLYRLPPRRIDELRRTVLDARHRPLLVTMPKVELHCHIGGLLDLPAQRQVAAAVWDTMTSGEQVWARAELARIPWTDSARWPAVLRNSAQRTALAVAALIEFDDARLNAILYAPTEPRLALRARHPLGFSAYELPGELSGSALLAHPAALQPYARAIVARAKADGLWSLELRGSPHKYRPADPLGWLTEFQAAMGSAVREADSALRWGFILIADRRQRDRVADVVKLACDARERLGSMVLGCDLAGDEGTARPEELAPAFERAFDSCLPLTIHAGEGEAADRIWQAAYRLHADRIGHGLTLLERPELLEKFRERRIALELCPTSNREVVGFADPALPASAALPRYPLQELWAAGLPLTLCTDNPGLSRTTLADEYLAASRMSGGLSLWETLALIRQGFLHAFLSSAEREALIKQADAALFQQMAGLDLETE